MTKLNKIGLQLIAVFAISTAVYSLSIDVLKRGELQSLGNFISFFFSLTINFIALYGGYHLWKGNDIGRKLLLVWLYCLILSIVINGLGVAILAIFKRDIQVGFSTQMPIQIVIGFYLTCITALVFLLKNKLQSTSTEDDRRLHAIAKALSLLAPGLGRVLLGNTVAGFVWLLVYLFIMTSINYVSGNLGPFDFFINLVMKLVVWRIFSAYDWSVVESSERSAQESILPESSLNSHQVNGG